MEARRLVTGALAEEVQLGGGLHAFSDDAQVEVVSEGDDAARDGAVALKGTGENLIDLEGVDGKRRAGAKATTSLCRSRRAMWTPSTLSSPSVVSRTWSVSPNTRSVISISSATAGNPTSARILSTRTANSPCTSRDDALTAMRNPPKPASRQNFSCRLACSRTQAVTLRLNPLCSAMGMKSLGGIRGRGAASGQALPRR